MATLVDTSALVVLLRRHPPHERAGTGAAAAAELRAGRALVAAVTVAELRVGARDAEAEGRVEALLDHLPAVPVDGEMARLAGRMGRDARARGVTLPLPDLLIAATSCWLDLPLLTCDTDFGRGAHLAARADQGEPWHGFRLHPGSLVG